MSIIDDIITQAKQIADQNGDGKLTGADIDTLRKSIEESVAKQFDGLKNAADHNQDGKVSFEDAESVFTTADKRADEALGGVRDGASNVVDRAKDIAGDVVENTKDFMDQNNDGKFGLDDVGEFGKNVKENLFGNDDKKA